MKRHLSTTEAAYYAGINPRSLRRWAKARGVEPERTQRIGRSTITIWSREKLERAACHVKAA